ncbi:MAG: oligoribonuclease [Pseudomonadota bacterium]|nr:oligoribonuclease [Pseudomonadota bacterium]
MAKLLWVDLEMSGLDVEKEVIIECAVVVTDMEFTALDTFHAVIKQPKKYLEGMDDWNKKHHKESGLIDQVPKGTDPERVEDELCHLLDKHFSNERAIIAGNSIAQDRLFINRHFKKFSSRLHYRMLDVSSWKIIFKEKYNISYEKKNAHRALDDIQESINELKHYLKFLRPSELVS